MAEQSRSSKRTRKKRLRYFFINGLLHKVLHISRPQDLVVCWNYPEHRRMTYSYSYIRTHHQRAWKTSEVAEMLNRDPRTLGHYWAAEDIPKPQASYGLTEHQQEYQYFWREEDILQLHEYCLTVHIGRPRKDKFIRTKPMPSRTELLAMLRHDTILYVKTDSGEFTPAWKEPEWQ